MVDGITGIAKMTKWQPLYAADGNSKSAPKDCLFMIRCGDEESVAQWNNDRKVFELKTPFSGKFSGSPLMWKELQEPPK
jgi:hypothetical protein